MNLEDQILLCDNCQLHDHKTGVVIDKITSNSLVCFVSDVSGNTDTDVFEELESELFIPTSFLYLLKCPTNKFDSKHFSWCHFFIEEQLRTINPKVIVIFGETAFKYLTAGIDLNSMRAIANNDYRFDVVVNNVIFSDQYNRKIMTTFSTKDPRLDKELLARRILDII